ncbi:HIT domain-containing protein [Nonomuraea sp. NPDC046570]|uniref:HIT family protein n=1 Tax=Nonomuraea sp. NPDC046570 TaxID=3155255 RepID=UPI00340E70B4
MNDCVFCEIVIGRQPSYRVLEDEYAVAFLDIAPASPGHTLVVPREHARDLWEISEVAHGHVARMVHRVAGLLNAVFAPEGVNVVHSTGEAAWQDVFHFHTHVVPRWHGDDLRVMWDSLPAPSHELEKVSERLTALR